MSILKRIHLPDILKRIKNNKHFNLGGPFFLLTAGCLFYLTQTQSIRYEFRKPKNLCKKDLVELGIILPDKVKTKSLEEIYDEKIKNKDISQWENKRIPRPWEE